MSILIFSCNLTKTNVTFNYFRILGRWQKNNYPKVRQIYRIYTRGCRSDPAIHGDPSAIQIFGSLWIATFFSFFPLGNYIRGGFKTICDVSETKKKIFRKIFFPVFLSERDIRLFLLYLDHYSCLYWY